MPCPLCGAGEGRRPLWPTAPCLGLQVPSALLGVGVRAARPGGGWVAETLPGQPETLLPSCQVEPTPHTTLPFLGGCLWGSGSNLGERLGPPTSQA